MKAARIYLHSLISPLPFITVSQAVKSALRPLYTLYKSALKGFDKKPNRYHCFIIQNHNF